jgi:hypothetical protein
MAVAPTPAGLGRSVEGMDNRSEVRDFLASRRARLSPEQVGLSRYGSRRVPGLRRAEVAQLAGVSVEYYTRLERGNLGGVSEAVLDSLVVSIRGPTCCTRAGRTQPTRAWRSCAGAARRAGPHPDRVQRGTRHSLGGQPGAAGELGGDKHRVRASEDQRERALTIRPATNLISLSGAATRRARRAPGAGCVPGSRLGPATSRGRR